MARNYLPCTLLASVIGTIQPTYANTNDTPTINWSAALEFEAFHIENYVDKTESDLVLAAASLESITTISSNLAATITLLYEEDDTPLEIDEAFIEQEFNNTTITLGQRYLPFGRYSTSVINDPLTAELTEIRESALSVASLYSIFSAEAYLFNGNRDDLSTLDNIGLRVDVSHQHQQLAWSINIDYINNISDADGLQDSEYDLSRRVSARAIAGNITLAGDDINAGIMAEYIATEKFSHSTMVMSADDAELNATHLELFVNSQIRDHATTFAIAYQTTDDAVDIELPATRVSVGMTIDISDALTLSTELIKDKDYGTSDGGTGKSASAVFFQLAVNI